MLSGSASRISGGAGLWSTQAWKQWLPFSEAAVERGANFCRWLGSRLASPGVAAASGEPETSLVRVRDRMAGLLDAAQVGDAYGLLVDHVTTDLPSSLSEQGFSLLARMVSPFHPMLSEHGRRQKGAVELDRAI